MGKKLFAVVVGVLAGFAVIAVIEGLSGLLYPVPAGFDLKDPVALARHIETLPPGAFVSVLAAHALGALVGGFAGVRVAGPPPWPAGALVVGVVILGAGIVNLLTIAHPAWFAVADVLVYLPMAILGGRLGRPAAVAGTG